MKTLNFIGCGRVGQTLGQLCNSHGVLHIQDVLTQSSTTAQTACQTMGAGAAATELVAMRPADFWLIGVQDAQIAAVAQELAATKQPLQGATVLHCSGALSSELLQPLHDAGAFTASAHCILSFASVPAAVQQFPGTVCALEGDAEAVRSLRLVLQAIGAQCFELERDHKVLYHAAAVFATNFTPVLQALAEEAWRVTGVPAPWIAPLRNALLRNACDNIIQRGPLGALTGPAARGDLGAIARQASTVRAWDPQAADAYEALSALALRLAKTAKDNTASNATQR